MLPPVQLRACRADAAVALGRQAKELTDHLEGVLKPFSVEVINGKGYVEARPRGVSKGAITSQVMHATPLADYWRWLTHTAPFPSCCVSLQMWTWRWRWGMTWRMSPCSRRWSRPRWTTGCVPHRRSARAGAHGSAAHAAVQRRFTCVVGRKPSSARFYVDTVAEVESLFTALRMTAKRVRRDPRRFPRGLRASPSRPPQCKGASSIADLRSLSARGYSGSLGTEPGARECVRPAAGPPRAGAQLTPRGAGWRARRAWSGGSMQPPTTRGTAATAMKRTRRLCWSARA